MSELLDSTSVIHSFIGFFLPNRVEAGFKAFVLVVSIVSFLSGLFPFLFNATTSLYSPVKKPLLSLVVQAISLGVKASSSWFVFSEASNFHKHYEEFKQKLSPKDGANSTSLFSAEGWKLTNSFITEILTQKNVYFSLSVAVFVFIFFKIISTYRITAKNGASLAKESRISTVVLYLLPFLALFISESLMVELFRGSKVTDPYKAAVIMRYIIRGLSMGCGLNAIRTLSVFYGAIGALIYASMFLIALGFARLVLDQVLESSLEGADLNGNMYQIARGLRIGSSLYIASDYIIPELLGTLEYFYISIIGIMVGYTAEGKYLNIDRAVNVPLGH